MQQSKLPENLETENIYRMHPGDTGYTVPWAICADEKRNLWIRGDYSVYPSPVRDTVHVLIERTVEGVIVDTSTLRDHKYDLEGMPLFAWHPLPVQLK